MKKAWASASIKQGFTIVELVVVVVVIAVLAVLVSITYTNVQAGVRDTQRSKDLTSLKLAIEKYHADNSAYPNPCGVDVGCDVSNLSFALSPYLDSIPVDPTSQYYQYVTGSASTDSYGLLVNYEVHTDCKTGKNINSAWWGVSYPTCTD